MEHPITEMVTGFDLVKEQLAVAAGNLVLKERYEQTGHSIECRICAEDPERSFLPGLVRRFRPPSGRTWRGNPRYPVTKSLYHDPMIAKVATWGQTKRRSTV